MNERIITLEYQLYEGDVRPATTGLYHFPLGTMFVGLLETLHINRVDGRWEVTNPKDDPERNWVGHADNQQLAILDYLRARLGIPEQGA